MTIPDVFFSSRTGKITIPPGHILRGDSRGYSEAVLPAFSMLSIQHNKLLTGDPANKPVEISRITLDQSAILPPNNIMAGNNSGEPVGISKIEQQHMFDIPEGKLVSGGPGGSVAFVNQYSPPHLDSGQILIGDDSGNTVAKQIFDIVKLESIKSLPTNHTYVGSSQGIITEAKNAWFGISSFDTLLPNGKIIIGGSNGAEVRTLHDEIYSVLPPLGENQTWRAINEGGALIVKATDALTSIENSVTNIFSAFDRSIQGAGQLADKITGVFNSFTNAVNSVAGIPIAINNTVDSIKYIFESAAEFNVSFASLAEKAGYSFGKGLVLGAFVESFITYNDLANTKVRISGDVEGVGYVNTPRFNAFAPQSWWSNEVEVKLKDVILAKSGRAINIVFDNALPYGGVGNRKESSSAFNVCSTDSGTNRFARDPRPVSIGLKAYYSNSVEKLFEGGEAYGQTGYEFRSSFKYKDTLTNASEKLVTDTFGLYLCNSYRNSERRALFGLATQYAGARFESVYPVFEIKDEQFNIQFHRGLDLQSNHIVGLPIPTFPTEASSKEYVDSKFVNAVFVGDYMKLVIINELGAVSPEEGRAVLS